jgi:acyl-CoA reductase-like NAD-dependent aldehyde dehydrogenase
MLVRDEIYVDGAWRKPSAGTSTFHEVTDSATEEVIARVVACTAADVDAAVAAARGAQEAWAARPVEERAKLLEQLQAGLVERIPEIAKLVSAEVGMPLRQAQQIQAGYPALLAGVAAAQVRAYPFEERLNNALIVREPVGVVGCITPWNYPLLQAMQKIAPAFAAGCTVVLKPSEVAPLSAFILAEVIHKVGFPAGVFNLVSGDGPTVGEAIASHPQIDMVSFTGSTRAGKRVSELAAQTVKRVALELGGKSVNLILPDADLDQAITAGLRNCFLNSGQTCIAQTRLLVQRAQHDQAVALVKSKVEALTVGDPRDESTRIGPLSSAAQRDRVRGYIRKGLEEGATLVTGGPDAPDGLRAGFYVKPTVFANVKNDMTIAQEEIFGPVLSIVPYDDEEQAVRIANDSIYGLSGAVWSKDAERAKAVARRLRTGQVYVNGGRGDPTAPFGGFKQSGLGRESGKYGLEEFLELKALQL